MKPGLPKFKVSPLISGIVLYIFNLEKFQTRADNVKLGSGWGERVLHMIGIKV